MRRIEYYLYNISARFRTLLGLHHISSRRALQRFLESGNREILFVCLGNICRSPYASAKLQELLRGTPFEDVRIISAGTNTSPGKFADETGAAVARKRSVDLSKHRTSKLSPELLTRAGLVIVMEPRHLRAVLETDPQAKSKTIFLGEFGLAGGEQLIIRDPYGKTEAVFSSCFDRIDLALTTLVRELLRNTRPRGEMDIMQPSEG